MMVSKRPVHSRSATCESGRDDGPCWSTTTDQPRSAMRRRAVPSFQWSSRLNPPKTTLAVLIGVPPPWRDKVSTTAGSPFASVRLFPMNRTRPPAGSFLRDASGCEGTIDDELQLVTTAAATMTLITEFLTAGARVIGYRAPCSGQKGIGDEVSGNLE